jgi:two-component system sensor histidine kinase VanS
VATTAREGECVRLRVENTGQRLTPELVATLTEPFQRGTERVRGHAGVGLGLAIVERMARAHGGTLTVAPRPDGGLTVDVRLPGGVPRRPIGSPTTSAGPEREAVLA